MYSKSSPKLVLCGGKETHTFVRRVMKNDGKQTLLRMALAAIVVLHFAVVLWHGSAHNNVPVPMTTMQTAFVAIVILLLPLAGTALAWSRFLQIGAWLIALSMLGSLLFGVINHFILASPDNVAQVPEHAARHSFVLSAYLLVVTEALGTVIGLIALRALFQNRHRNIINNL